MAAANSGARALRLRTGSSFGLTLTYQAAHTLDAQPRRVLDFEVFPDQVLTREVPGLSAEATSHLDSQGLVAPGSAVGPGMVLLGRVKAGEPPQDQAPRCPVGVAGVVVSVVRVEGERRGPARTRVIVQVDRPLRVGDVVEAGGRREVVSRLVSSVPGGDDGEWPGPAGGFEVTRVEPLAEDVVAARCTGPYSLITERPLLGRAQRGGQPVEVRELEALVGLGAPHLAHELVTCKGDDVEGRQRTYERLVAGEEEPAFGRPFRVAQLEALLTSLGLAARLDDAQPRVTWLDDAAVRALAPGVVVKPETLNYRTLRPERGGLFDEALFGAKGSDRYEQGGLARLEFVAPLLPWGARAAAASALGWTRAQVDEVLDREPAPDEGEGPYGGAALAAALAGARLPDGRGAEALLVTCWPVLPPKLRPLVALEGGRFATSDLNDLYRRLINRNNRARRLMELNAPAVIVRNELRVLQAAFDTLVDNEHTHHVSGPEERELVSLMGLLGGIPAPFSADYSGVAVAVVHPELGEREVRLPRVMAQELFQPWLRSRQRATGQAPSDLALATVVAERPLLALAQVPAAQPRAFGVQASVWDEVALAVSPRLAEGLALKPGGQVVVHVPLGSQACAEARALDFERSWQDPSPGQPGWLTELASASHERLVQLALDQVSDPVDGLGARLLLGRLLG